MIKKSNRKNNVALYTNLTTDKATTLVHEVLQKIQLHLVMSDIYFFVEISDWQILSKD